MWEILQAKATSHGGYLYRSEFLDGGYTDRDIGEAMRAGLIERLRHGTYAFTVDLNPLSPERRHLLVAYSVIDKLGPGVALSHHTAAIAHTGVSYGVDRSIVHLTRLDGKHGRRESGVAHHVGHVVTDADLIEVDGRLCTSPTRAVIESASCASVESGMVTASFAIRSGGCSGNEIAEAMERMKRWPGAAKVRLALQYSEPLCESVGEVRSLYMFMCERIPRPQPQFVVMRDGLEIARTDFAWLEERHVGEFDGRVKYGRLNPDPEDPGGVVFKEKRREDWVRGEQFGMSRWTWFCMSLSQRAVTGRRIRADLELSRRLYGRNAVHIPTS